MDDERARRAAEQEQRANETLEAIFRGGDLAEETLKLSNDYSDRQSARVAAWFRRLRSPRDKSAR